MPPEFNRILEASIWCLDRVSPVRNLSKLVCNVFSLDEVNVPLIKGRITVKTHWTRECLPSLAHPEMSEILSG